MFVRRLLMPQSDQARSGGLGWQSNYSIFNRTREGLKGQCTSS